MPPLGFYCDGRCWDRSQDHCDLGIGSQTITTRLDLIHTQLGINFHLDHQCCGSGML
jgi:hypothetical protein